MQINLFDVVGIILFISISSIVDKKGWFFSFYSFVKFILIFALSLAISLYLAGKNKYDLPLTNLQLSLLIQSISFVILWRLISFRKVFFKATDGIIQFNHFIFLHRIDKVLNFFPSVIVSFFLVFSLLTFAVSAATSSPRLQKEIENSRIVKPALYKIYFATLSSQNLGLFENVAYKIVPTVGVPLTPDFSEVKESALKAFNEKVNQQREKIGLQPLVFFLIPHISNTKTIEPSNREPNIVAYTPPTSAPPTPQTQISTPTPFRAQNVYIVTRPETPISVPTTPAIASQQVYVIQPTEAPPDLPFYTDPTATPVIFPVTATPAPQPIFQQPSVDTNQAEQDILRLTNEERTKNGLPPLSWSDAISAIARAHSQDMVTRNFFDHVNPDGLNPFDRMRAGGISYSAAAENIAGAATADIIVTNWMNSPGHRKNILNPAYGKIGIGVVKSPKYGLMATQNFTN